MQNAKNPNDIRSHHLLIDFSHQIYFKKKNISESILFACKIGLKKQIGWIENNLKGERKKR